MISTTTISAKYTVTDGVLDYGIPFHIYDSADVSVIWSSDGLTDKSLTLDTDYSVTILSEGGTVTLVAGAVPIGSILVVESAIPATQNADFSSTTTVSTEALETQLDRQVQMIQQLSSGLDRAVKTPATSATTPEDMAEDIFDARDQAEQSATAAAASATAAADSATAAAGSATTASQEATAAADSADLASQKATAATGSAANAATQADNAAGSATAAADSATAAASSATAAKDSEDQAFNYASQSLGSAGQAQNYAAQSLDYAGQSLSSAQAAAGSATTASQEATAAAGSATTAADSADLSRRWASEDVDVPVQSGEYSAKHYAHKAKDAVPDNLVSRVEAVEGKTQSATTSTRGIGRVATAADMVTGATIDNGPAFLSVGSVVTPTPTANAVPQAGEDGTLDASWVPRPDCWDMFPPFVPVPIWGATPGGSDGRRAIMPGEEQAREEWLLCDGGSDGKDGTVPDLRGRYVRGASEAEPAGTTGGSEDVGVSLSGNTGATTLNTSQMPSHKHPFKFVTSSSSGTPGMVLIPGGVSNSSGTVSTNTSAVSATGSNGSHTHPLSGSISGTHTDPHIAMNYFIKVV